MKRLILAVLITAFASAAFAQTIDPRRKIEVTGSAEAEVTPDIIFVGISLREYFRDNNSKKKVEIEELERQLQTVVLNAGIPKENFTINNISSYNWTWEKKKNPDFLASKQYRIKISDLNKYNQIISAVDPKGIQYSNVEGYDYSKLESLKRELKIKALQLAKEKAIYLTEAINERLGGAMEINEINNEYYPQPMYQRNAMMKSDATMAESAPMPDIDFKKIKLNYQMRVVFELK
ncbi:MAG TPA: SIMPL domain-containing protein [Sphingobacteriaceae bacterium]|nr:SIMPL domain-containing protein [Sphingobacteriaceae bacterium]